MILAHHLILTGYGHWLPNDPRGSASTEVRRSALQDLGPMRTFFEGWTTPEQIREFHEDAAPRLAHPVLWLNEEQIQAVAEAITDWIARRGLTCYACAIMPEHTHLLMRVHRMKGHAMYHDVQGFSRRWMLGRALVPAGHPVWSDDVCVIFKDTPNAVRVAIEYIRDNPPKHDMPPQEWGFVRAFEWE